MAFSAKRIIPSYSVWKDGRESPRIPKKTEKVWKMKHPSGAVTNTTRRLCGPDPQSAWGLMVLRAATLLKMQPPTRVLSIPDNVDWEAGRSTTFRQIENTLISHFLLIFRFWGYHGS